jgi:hypothetical protein
MSSNTKNIDLNYISQNQSQKEILLNEAFLKIDSLLNTGAKSCSTVMPPSEPNESELYIIPVAATNEWENHDNEVTYFHSSKGWVFLTPNEGLTLWVNDEDVLYTYNGTGWVIAGAGEMVDKLGINASPDSINKLAVKSDAVLFDHNGTDSRIKASKATSTDTASHLFQNNYSGRAEFGLIGNNNFKLKLSDDGSIWQDVLEAKLSEIDVKKRIDAEAGILLTEGAVALSSYEESSWTPAMYGSTIAGTPSFSNQIGSYIRIGKIVIATFRVKLSSKGGMTGDVFIGGLPYAIASGTQFQFTGGLSIITGVTPASNHMVNISCPSAGGNALMLVQQLSTITRISATQITDSAELRGSITYFAAV